MRKITIKRTDFTGVYYDADAMTVEMRNGTTYSAVREPITALNISAEQPCGSRFIDKLQITRTAYLVACMSDEQFLKASSLYDEDKEYYAGEINRTITNADSTYTVWYFDRLHKQTLTEDFNSLDEVKRFKELLKKRSDKYIDTEEHKSLSEGEKRHISYWDYVHACDIEVRELTPSEVYDLFHKNTDKTDK